MSIAPTLQRYLTAENIQYDVIPHDPRSIPCSRIARPGPFRPGRCHALPLILDDSETLLRMLMRNLLA